MVPFDEVEPFVGFVVSLVLGDLPLAFVLGSSTLRGRIKSEEKALCIAAFSKFLALSLRSLFFLLCSGSECNIGKRLGLSCQSASQSLSLHLTPVLIFLTLASSVTYSNEVVINGTGTSNISGLTFSDGSKFRLFTSKGHWRASSGDYGLSDCYGTLKNDKNDDVQFEVFCNMIAQDEEAFVMKFYRNKGSQDVGTGKAIIVDLSLIHI